jgi:phosphohistidine phosphatase
VPALILFRHAKSDWHGTHSDRERPLSPRGRRAAGTMGRFLAEARELPDAAITSPATRATQTLRLAMDAGAWTCPVRECETLYGNDVAALWEEIQRQDDSVRVLIAVGHEPTWSEAAAALSGGEQLRLPTAAMARIDFDGTEWSHVQPGTGLLTWLVNPRLVDRR